MIGMKGAFIIHGGDPVAWAKRYELDLSRMGEWCECCGMRLCQWVPFVRGRARGLIAPCECGNSPRVLSVPGGDLTDLFGGDR